MFTEGKHIVFATFLLPLLPLLQTVTSDLVNDLNQTVCYHGNWCWVTSCCNFIAGGI